VIGSRLTLRPSAKINLTLHVGPRRADGFHDVRTVLQSIALSDRLTLTLERGPFSLDVKRAAAPAGKMNLVWRAAELMWRALGRRGDPHGVRMTLEKGIPSAAGLGGGSADAAAALAGLHKLWRGRLPRAELLALGAELGSDVPFFFAGGTALALGRGTEIYPLADSVPMALLLIKPAVEISTAEAYRWFDDDAARAEAGAAGAVRSVDLGWVTGPISLSNSLQAPVARRHPAIAKAVDALVEAGARGAMMSGSGSSVYGVFAASAVGRAAARLARPDWQVIPTRTLSRRVACRRIGLC
jgi:4-diphosphocytidyl-2-C-methyl-D-erythritol kinase